MADTSLLTLSGMDVTPYSARGLKQTLEPIDAAGNLRRTINGTLNDLSLVQFRKYRSTISGEDQQPPALEGVWQGVTVTVGCVAELAYLTGLAGAPHRTVVAGSSRVEGSFTFYRPQLDMRITAFQVERDEYGAVDSWSIDLEEI
jgi:hypothetical protein